MITKLIMILRSNPRLLTGEKQLKTGTTANLVED